MSEKLVYEIKVEEFKIDVAACIGCGACVDVCEVDVLRLRGAQFRAAKAAAVRPEDCVMCFACQRMCPANAISITGPLLPSA